MRLTGTLIQLTEKEIRRGVSVGCERQIENILLKRKTTYGAENMPHWQTHIEGALGELALSIFLGVEWQGKGVLGGPDVGQYEVRTTQYSTGHLTLHPKDADGSLFWLLTGVEGRYVVRGKIHGIDGKLKSYWSELVKGRPAFNVPQSALTKP